LFGPNHLIKGSVRYFFWPRGAVNRGRLGTAAVAQICPPSPADPAARAPPPPRTEYQNPLWVIWDWIPFFWVPARELEVASFIITGGSAIIEWKDGTPTGYLRYWVKHNNPPPLNITITSHT